jgi:hypothetical protein
MVCRVSDLILRLLSNKRFDLPDFFSCGLMKHFGLVCAQPVLVVSIAITPRAARAFGPAVHPTSCAASDCCLSAGMTGSGLCTTSEGFG